MSAEKSVNVHVRPGNETGIYYILLGYLAPNVFWRPLKSWISREAKCKVDKVEVFLDTRSGWVRLVGRDNFERAWAKLKLAPEYQGSPIVATIGNLNQSCTIASKVDQPDSQKEEQQQQPQRQQQQQPQQYPQQQQQNLPPPVVAYSQTPGYPPAAQGHQAAASSTTSPQYSSTSGQYYAAGYNQAGGSSYSGQSMPMQGYPLQPTGTTDYYGYGGSNAGPSSGVGYSSGYQYDGNQFALPYRDQQDASAYYAGGSVPGAPGAPGQEPAYQTETGAEFVTTEARKIHVSPFPQKDSRKDVERWIRQRIYEKQTIDSIEVPMNGTKKYLRGHALVIFDSASSAAKAMEQLNKTSYQGRKIKARTAAEGVAVGEGSTQKGPRNDRNKGDKPQRPRHREPDRKWSSSDKKSSSSAKKSSKTSSLPDKDKKGSSSTRDLPPPLVVDGSNRSHDKPPLVVDGTSRRHDKR